MTTPPALPPQGGARRHAGAEAEDQPVDMDGLIVAGTGEFDEEPARRSAIRFALSVAVFLLLAVLLVYVPMYGIMAWFESQRIVCGPFDEQGPWCGQIFYWPG